MLNKKTIKRLTILADYLDALPNEAADNFYMGWFYNDWHSEVTPDQVKKQDLLSCGTSACAAGWAATIPAFKRQGYSMGELSSLGYYFLEEFFLLNYNQVEHLFSSSLDGSIYTPKQWAKHARKFMKDEKDRP